MSDEMTTAQCKDCEEVKKVHPDTGLCDDCEEDYVYCSVCNEHHHEDNICRHVFWDGMEGWWAGPGADDPCYNRIEDYKEAILFFVGNLDTSNTGVKAATRLLGALKTGTLRLSFWGSLLGPSCVAMEGTDEDGSDIYWPEIAGEACHGASDWTEEQEHLFESGYYWLMALDAKTPRERALVIQWIEAIQKGD